jgi:HD superfamily phosphohydrolase
MNNHVIKDPVHGTMQFTSTEDNWIKPFIDSPPFQRLRHIKQLGMGDYIFPGAVHTRFNHCLGCSYTASQISKKIGLPEKEQQLVMIACLLHDIGHGPFSHTFEDLFADNLIRHEDWTPFFLQSYRNDEFFHSYNTRNQKYPLTDENFQWIADMIMHQSTRNSLLSDIVSSQLDADRLDYLLRDSHFCGVAYGKYDFHWMLNSMIMIEAKEGTRLGLTHKGIGVVEHYLMARRLMVKNIYRHQKKLAFEYYLIKLLAHLAEHLESFSAFAAIKKTRLGKFLCAVNRFNMEKSTANKKTFLEKNYPTYKELSDYDVFSVIKTLAEMQENHPCIDIAKRLQTRCMPKIVHLDLNQLTEIDHLIQTFKTKYQIPDWQLTIIKNPHQSYTPEDDPILIMNENGIVKPLTEMSMMIKAIGGKLEETAFLSIDKNLHENKELQNILFDLRNKQR